MPTCIQIIAAVVIYCSGPAAPAPRTPAQAVAIFAAGAGRPSPAAGVGLDRSPMQDVNLPAARALTIAPGDTYQARQAIVEANYQAAVLATRAATAPVLNVIVTDAGTASRTR